MLVKQHCVQKSSKGKKQTADDIPVLIEAQTEGCDHPKKGQYIQSISPCRVIEPSHNHGSRYKKQRHAKKSPDRLATKSQHDNALFTLEQETTQQEQPP